MLTKEENDIEIKKVAKEIDLTFLSQASWALLVMSPDQLRTP